MRVIGVRALLLGTTAVFCSTGVAAQEGTGGVVAPQAQEMSRSAASEGDIVVTARRRDESLMSVPVAVSALSSETLERYNATDLGAIGELTPSVIVADYKLNGGGSIAIRGISTPATQVGFEQAVSVAVDGIQSSNGQMTQLGFFDLQQVEVLKGPQALFFGKNNTAGVISIATAGPTPDFQVRLRAGYEFRADELITEAAVSGPITDTLGARLAVRYRNMEGYLRNLARPIANPFYNPATGAPASVATLPGASDTRPGESEFLGRLTLKFEPSSDFTATLKVAANYSDDSGAGIATQNIGPCSGPNPRVNGVADPFGECVPDNRVTSGDVPAHIASTIRGRGVNADGSPSGRMKLWLGSLDMRYHTGPLTISSLTGLSSMRYRYFSGADQTTYSQLTVYEDQVQRDFSQEIRLSSDFEGNFNFLLGGFYQHSFRSVVNDNKLNDGHYNLAENRYTGFHNYATQPGDTLSAFGQLIWEFVPTLELAGGLRWTQEKKRFRKIGLYGFGSFDVTTTNFPGSNEAGVLQGRFKDENLSPEVTLTWRPDNDHTIFLAYRTGFKSGGFGMTNPLQRSTTIGAVDFDSETAEGFELGAKGRFFDNKLSLTTNLFAYEFNNLQVNTYDPALIAYTINNAGSLKQRGFDIEASYRPNHNLTLHGALAYIDNKFENFIGQCYAYTFPTGATRATATPPPNCSFVNTTSLTLQQDYDGRTPARSPKWTGNAGIDLRVPTGNLVFGATADAYYTGGYYAADTLAPPTYQPDFWTFNASLSVASADDRWKLSLLGRNLANKYYVIYAVDRTGGVGVPGAIGEQRGVVSRGREVTLQAQFNF
ncbi:MAG: TonB-dependent receptor [Novosphingobium sp.]